MRTRYVLATFFSATFFCDDLVFQAVGFWTFNAKCPGILMVSAARLTARKTVRLLPPFFAPFAMAFQREVFSTFWLGNVLRATTACTFSTTQLPKVLWTWCILYILTSKCASRHNGVQLFIPYLATWLRTRRFSEPTFRPSGATNHWKNTVSRDFSTFSRTRIFFLLTLSLSLLFSSLRFASLRFSSLLWLFPPLLFHLAILSEVWLLNFLRLYNIGVSATSWLSQVPCAHVVCSGKTFNGWSTHHFITSIRMDIDPLELVAGCDEKEGYLSIFTTVLVFFSPFPSIWGKWWQTGIY